MKKSECCVCGTGFYSIYKRNTCSPQCAKIRRGNAGGVCRPCAKCDRQSAKNNPSTLGPYLCSQCRIKAPRSFSCKECGRYGAWKRLALCDLCGYLADERPRVSALPRDCQCCGNRFTPKANIAAVFCSKACCSKRGRKPNATCPVCNEGFYKNPAQPNRKTCSQRCWSALVSRKRGPVSVTRYRAACNKCGVLHWSNIPNKVRCDACKRAPAYLEPRNCTICGVLWQPLVRNAFGPRSLCGAASCLAAHEEIVRQRERDGRNRSRRIHGNKSTHRKRARHYGVYYEPIDVKFVFNRDRWHCKICGVSTPKRLRGSCEPNAPELDHIIPLSLGGAHAYDNVQCACRACNGAKGNSKAIGQLLMFAAA